MAVQKIEITEFLNLSQIHLLIDVRSPSEYAHAHIPNAKNLPLFNDEERKIVGTSYKQQSRENAIKIGLDFFGPKMRTMVEEVDKMLEEKKSKDKIILVHCWRGGMRSAGVAWLLDLYGFKVYTLVGGYKTYRSFILEQFTKPYNFNIIGGYTGSGKTYLLDALKKNGSITINLEGLANHKGSALGALGMPAQPTQEMFENKLGMELLHTQKILLDSVDTNNHQLPTINDQLPTANCIWLEDESQRIGNLMIPQALWQTMRSSKVFFMDIPFEERLQFLTNEYGSHKKEGLVNATIRIQKRLGGLETKNCINFLVENNFKEAFRILLTYYDKHYLKGLYKRENVGELLTKINAEKVDTNNFKLL